MKKILSLALIMLIVLISSCEKDNNNDDVTEGGNDPESGCTNPDAANYDPDAKNDDGSCVLPDTKARPMLLEYTSRCCAPCGQWGHETFETLYQTYGTDVVPIAVHSNLNTCLDPMVNETLKASFIKFFSNDGKVPSFYIGNANSYETTVIDDYLASSPIANAAFTTTKSGNKIIVNTVTHFNDNPQGDVYYGDYYISALAVESHIDGSNNADTEYDQEGNDDDIYYHNFVLRASSSPNSVYGTKIAEDQVADDAVIHQELEIELEDSWNYSQINVVVLLFYRKTNGTYLFVNAIDNR